VKSLARQGSRQPIFLSASIPTPPPPHHQETRPSRQNRQFTGHTQHVNSPPALLVLYQCPACEVARLSRQLEHLLIQAQLVAGPQHSGAHPVTHGDKHELTCATRRTWSVLKTFRPAPRCAPCMHTIPGVKRHNTYLQVQPTLSAVSGTAGCRTPGQWCAPCDTWRHTCARHHAPYVTP
jgi:hypothetical protein